MALPHFPLESFWSKIDRRGPDECWPWIACRQRFGGDYGRFRRYRAHRVAYELHYGVAPGGLCVCHRCDNPPCCNPAHLFLGTRSENLLDSIVKGRRKYERRARAAERQSQQAA